VALPGPHADLCLHLAGALRARALGDDEAARGAWERTAHFVREHETDLHPALDVYEFLYVLGKLFADPE
jgi:hypothetical protein